jgi:two-component system sensor histidine kinase PilS (NtrC family)
MSMAAPDNILPRQPDQALTDLAWRVIGLINIYRLLVAAAFVALGSLPVLRTSFNMTSGNLLLLSAGSYLTGALALLALPQRVWPGLRSLAITHAGIDSLALGILLFAVGGVGSGFGILLVLPIGAMAMLAENRDAYFMTSLATIALLVQQSLGANTNGSDYLLTGILGVVLFVVTAAVRPIATSLRESEALVRRQEIDLANLAQLSQYIVTHLRESMLVIDKNDRIRLINDAAAKVLGETAALPGARLLDVAPRLTAMLGQWRSTSALNAMPDSALTAADGARLLQPHFAPLGGDDRRDLVLIFLEDTALLAERVQQSKLAALGRLSASIAHEIRNPIGAMSHAGQLLAESASLSPIERRLTGIIHANGERVSRLIGSMLEFSRRGTSKPERLLLSPWLTSFRQEFLATHELAAGRLLILPALQPDIAAELEVRTDPTQLHQVVWNLCHNAITHGASSSPSAVELRFGRLGGNGRPYMEVADRGPGIDVPDVERVFEPFYSKSDKGTGLGLFLARELAQTNGATLLFEPRSGGGSLFRLVVSDPVRWVQ